MSHFEEVFERIKLATSTRTQIELATVLDIRQSSISDAKRRNSIPSDWCMKLFERYGLNPDWIKKGTGPMYLRTEMGYSPVDAALPVTAHEDPALYSDPNAKSDIVSVLSMQTWPSEGTGTPRVLGKLAVPQPMVNEGIKVFQVDSTGMEPLIRKGAYIGVDITQKQVLSGELYAVNLPYEGASLKRIFPNSGGGEAILRAENPQHPEIVLPAERLADAVIGRVVWAFNKY